MSLLNTINAVELETYNWFPTFEKDFSESTFMKDEFQTLCEYKTRIDRIQYKQFWEISKRYINPYELIFTNSKTHFIEHVSRKLPISRSYFKMIEILELLPPLSKTSKVFAHLAEGPGGFIEATYDCRELKFRAKDKSKDKSKDKYYGISLIDKNCPSWRLPFISGGSNVQLLYGADKTGNLYNPENIKDFVKKVGEQTADIVTGDGGFDCSSNFNMQETLCHKIIFCQIITALLIQKNGGCFVCKFFDLHTNLSLEIIYMLKILYEEVLIIKPYSSRFANSERYIVCKNFDVFKMRAIWENPKLQLLSILQKWNDTGLHLKSLGFYHNLMADLDFINSVKAFNIRMICQQIMNLIKGFHFCDTYNPTKEDFNNYNRFQLENALWWCDKYKIPINPDAEVLYQKLLNNNRQNSNIMDILKKVDEIEKTLAELPNGMDIEQKTKQLNSIPSYAEFSERYPTLFEMIVKNGTIDRNILEYMLNIKSHMAGDNNKNAADALVGQKLFDKFVKPNIDEAL